MRKQAQRGWMVCQRSHSKFTVKSGDSSRLGPEPQESFLLCYSPLYALWNKLLLYFSKPMARAPGKREKRAFKLFLQGSHFSKRYSQSPGIKYMWKKGCLSPYAWSHTKPVEHLKGIIRIKETSSNVILFIICYPLSTAGTLPPALFSPAQVPRANQCSTPPSLPPPHPAIKTY